MAGSAWRYRFHSIDESDFNDVFDGSEFFVNYIGCTAINDIPSDDPQIDDLFNNVVSQSRQSPVNGQLCKLTVNGKGAMIYDSEGGTTLLSFESYNICYVTTTSTWKYSKYFIIVAKTRHEQSLKGHVLLCKNKANAKRICRTFTKMFKTAVPITVLISDNDEDNEVVCTKSDEHKTKNQREVRVYSADETRKPFNPRQEFPTRNLNKHALCSVKNPVKITPDRQADDNHEELFDDGFTELARSRSSSSDITAPLSDSFSKEIITPYQSNDSVFY